MKKIIAIFAIAVILFGGMDVMAKPKKKKSDHGDSPTADSLVFKNRNYLGLWMNRISSAAYYEEEGTQFPDVICPLDENHDSVYTFKNHVYLVGLDISQTLINNPNFCIFARASAPFAINSISKKWADNGTNDSIGSHSLVYDNTNIPYVSLGLGADYRYKNFYLSGGLDWRISTLETDTAGIGVEVYEMYYGSVKPYLSAIYRGEKTYCELGAGYTSYIDSPVSDMFHLKFGAGLITVEQSAFGVFLQYNKSVDKIDMKSRPFDPFQYQYQEENLRLGIYFDILIEKRFLPGISYELTLAGKNTPQVGIFRLYAKYIIGFLSKNDNYQ